MQVGKPIARGGLFGSPVFVDMNDKTSGDGCLKVVMLLIFIIFLIIFGIYLLFEKTLIGVIYWSIFYIYLEKARRKQVKYEENAKKTLLELLRSGDKFGLVDLYPLKWRVDASRQIADESTLKYMKSQEDLKKRLEKYNEKAKKREVTRKKLQKEFNLWYRKNTKPTKIIKHRGCKIKLYSLPLGNSAYKIVDWDEKTINEIYVSLKEAKEKISSLYPFDKTKIEYLAEKERELRKKEDLRFLANAYKQRQKKSAIRKNIVIIDNLYNLTPVEFEKWVKKHVFEKDGWIVSETKTTGDGGIDLILEKNDEYSIAQCKRFRKTVGEPMLRDFYGTMMSEGVSRGYFVTTGLFSLSAQKFAQEKPIILMDRRVLANLL